MSLNTKHFSRRQALAAATAGLLAAALAPRLVQADEAAVAAALKELFGERAITDGRIRIDIPQIAENGLVVPINIHVESPMTGADHVKALHLFAPGNPQPRVLTYHFTPESGRASASTRIRLAKTQSVIAVAEMSNGQVYSAKAQVKVTIGGCGG
jgi:sulfur-oxidizing protein SoxY